MKKLVVVCALALVSFAVKAQDNTGKFFMTGTLGYNSEEQGNDKSNDMTIMPSFGTYLSNDFTVGLMVGYDSNYEKAGDLVITDRSTITIQPYARKYWNICKRVNLFGQASLPISFGNNDVAKSKTTSFGLDAAPGVEFALGNHLSFDVWMPLFNLRMSTTKPETGDKTSTVNFGFAPQGNDGNGANLDGLRIGLKYTF